MNDRQQGSTTHPMTFLMVLTSDHTTGATGITPVVAIAKDGGPFVTPLGAITEMALATPSTPTTSGAATTGGSLSQSVTYYYKVTAFNLVGETLPSGETTYAVPASGTNTNQITLNWSAVTNATGYKVYRSTVIGNELQLATLGNVITYADTSSTTPAGAIPVANTTSGGRYAVAGHATDRNTLGEFAIHVTGTGCDPVDRDYTIVGFDPFDSQRMGLTALPSSGTVAVKPAVTLATADVSGNLPANAVQWGGSAVTGMPLPTSSYIPAVTVDGGTVTTTATPTATIFTATGASLHAPNGGYTIVPQTLLFTSGVNQGLRSTISNHTLGSGTHTFTVSAFPSAPSLGDTFVII